jgi:pyridoxal 5'-phosphate synthase pdxT subunit
MTVGVLALQGDVREHVAALDALGRSVRLVRRPEDLGGLRGLILPGGESTTLSLLLDSSGLREPLARVLGEGLPVFGTCAGMILLAAEVLDGRDDQRHFGLIDLAVRRNGFGRQQASFECELAVSGMDGSPFRTVFIRAPVVERAGPGVEVLATLPATPDRPVPQPVLCRQGPVLVSSFHPELTGDRRLHGLFTAMMDRGEDGDGGTAVTNQERRN